MKPRSLFFFFSLRISFPFRALSEISSSFFSSLSRVAESLETQARTLFSFPPPLFFLSSREGASLFFSPLFAILKDGNWPVGREVSSSSFFTPPGPEGTERSGPAPLFFFFSRERNWRNPFFPFFSLLDRTRRPSSFPLFPLLPALARHSRPQPWRLPPFLFSSFLQAFRKPFFPRKFSERAFPGRVLFFLYLLIFSPFFFFFFLFFFWNMIRDRLAGYPLFFFFSDFSLLRSI